ncbi:NAD(P)/FAD-dependent oxidoreductase [Streptomyces griseoincarnatus]
MLKRTLTDNVRGTKRHRPADQPGGKNALMAALPAGARAGNRPARGGADRPARGGRETPERARHTARRGPSSTRPADDLVQAGRSLLDGKAARRATDVESELETRGAVRTNLLDGPRRFGEAGAWLPGDERFAMMTARRPLLEAALDQAAAGRDRLEARRGTAVAALLPGNERVPRRPHVRGVLTRDGEAVHADLVVDASGQNSAVGRVRVLRDLGAPGLPEEHADAGFLAYSHHFRSTDGSVSRVPPRAHHDRARPRRPGDRHHPQGPRRAGPAAG